MKGALTIESKGQIVQQTKKIKGYFGKRKKILVVDDKQENRDVVRASLESIGFEISEAKDGKECLTILKTQRLDLVLLDLVMPGFEAARRIKKSKKLNSIPILAVSASVYEKNQKESFKAGCDDFLSKPLKISELLEKIGNVLKLKYD